MKINRTLLIISMVFISLVAISAVSASDNATDITEATDVDEVQVSDDIDQDDVLAAENDDEAIAVADDEDVVKANGTGGMGMGNMTGMGMGNMSGMDWGSMDWSSMFGGGSNSISAKDVSTYYAGKTSYKVTLLDSKKNPIAGKYVVFTINNKEIAVKTNSKGVATLKVKLVPGKYIVTAEYGDQMVKNTIKVKNSVITSNVVKKQKKAKNFKVKILNKKGKAYAKRIVTIKFNGKTYKIKTNKKGIASFKIPNKLKKGKYIIKTTYQGLTKKNIITVK